MRTLPQNVNLNDVKKLMKNMEIEETNDILITQKNDVLHILKLKCGTYANMAKLLNVSPMTVYNWTKPTFKKLPEKAIKLNEFTSQEIHNAIINRRTLHIDENGTATLVDNDNENKLIAVYNRVALAVNQLEIEKNRIAEMGKSYSETLTKITELTEYIARLNEDNTRLIENIARLNENNTALSDRVASLESLLIDWSGAVSPEWREWVSARIAQAQA